MDIGKPGYTEFENGTDIAEYVMKNPSVMNYRMGLIHSHNTMPTFFSGEDNDELRRNTRIGDSSYYFSLIVNNKLDVSARLTKRLKTGNVQDQYLGLVSNEAIYYSEFEGSLINPYGLSDYQLARFTALDTKNKERILQSNVTRISELPSYDSNAVGIKEALAYCIALDERASTIQEAIEWQLEFLSTPEAIKELQDDYLDNLKHYIEAHKLEEHHVNLINEFSYPEFIKLFHKSWNEVWKIIKQDSKTLSGSTF